MIPKTILVESEDFINGWARTVQQVLGKGVLMPADDVRNIERLEVCAVLDFSGDAIQQILNKELHPEYPQQHGLDHYIKQFEPGTDEAIASEKDQPYTYLGRTIAQVRQLAELGSLTRLFTNRFQAITWDFDEDLTSDNPPCLQRIWIKNIGNDEVIVHLTWRSHDLFSAWQWNIIAIFDYLNRELFQPLGLKVVKFVEFNDSLHIYDYDIEKAKKVRPIPKYFPMG